MMIPGWLVALTGGAVGMGWIYERANSSLLIVALFHAFLNKASATVGTAGLPAIVTSVVIIAWAVTILRGEATQLSS